MLGALSGSRRTMACATSMLALLALGACENEANPTDPGNGGGEAPILTDVISGPVNATSSDTLVAFNLTTNSVVPNKTTGDWDIAFRRYEVRVNSIATAGAATKNVTAYSIGNNKNKTDAEVLAFTIDNTKAAFDAITAASIPADNLFTADRLTENKYAYLNLAGAPTVNAGNYWKIKTANGGYALFHVTAIAFNAQNALSSVTIESRLQNGATLGTAQTLTVPLTTIANISLVTNSSVTANGCNWDIKIDPNALELTTNSACSVGTSPGSTNATFATTTSANDAPQYALYIASLTSPIPNSVTDINAPFRYDLIPDSHRLFPAFNTYLIKVGAKVFKVQVINYYNATGDAAYPTIRAARIL